MKEYIDFYATLSVELRNKRRIHNRLRKYWGTSVIDGVEVFNVLLPLWPGILFDKERILKVSKLFNITEKDILGHSKDGIESTFLYFNPLKIVSDDFNKEGIANLLEAQVPFDEWREFSITYTDSSDPNKFVGYSNEQILEYVKNNYQSGSMSRGLTTKGKIDGIDDFVGPYVLYDNGVDFQVEVTGATITAIGVTTTDSLYNVTNDKYENTQKYQSGISVSYKYKRIGYLNDNSPIVGALVNGLNTDPLDQFSNARGLMNRISPPVINTIWYNNQLRTDVVKTLKTQDYFKVVYGALDLGQTQKKAKSSVLTKVIGVIIAIIVFVFTLGTGTAISVAVLAAAFSAAALALTLYSIAMTMMGYPGTGMYIGRWAKVVGIVAAVLSIASAIQSFAKSVGTKAATTAATTAGASAATSVAQEAVTAATNEITIDAVVDTAIDMVKEGWNNSSVIGKLSVASKVIEPLVGLREKNKLKDLSSVHDEVKAQEAVLTELYDKNGHFGIEDIVMYTKPLTTSMLQYEIDWLYEEGPNNILRPSFARYGMNIISNDVLPITARKGYLSNLIVQ